MEAKQEKQKKKQFLNLAGEYGVCSELHKRGITASITYGMSKAADIVITKDKRAYVIEVKTSSGERVVTKFFQKYPTPDAEHQPDFWVIVHVDQETYLSEFYVLTHEEMTKEQMLRYNMTEWEDRRGGVCNIGLPLIQQYKNKWDTILKVIEQN